MDTEYRKIKQRQGSRATLEAIKRDQFLAFDTDQNHLVYCPDGVSYFDFYNSGEIEAKFTSAAGLFVARSGSTMTGQLNAPSVSATAVSASFYGPLNGNASTSTSAAQADKLKTSQTITIAGDVTATGQAFNGSAGVTLTTTLPAITTAGTYTKTVVNAKGQVTSGGALTSADIPVLDASKITTGTFDVARIPVLPSQIQITSTGTLSALTSAQTSAIGQGTVVTTTDGFRWVYTGSGSKTVSGSYTQLADITPDWSVISNRPTTVSTWTNDAGYLTNASSLSWSKVTGTPTTLAGYGVAASDSLFASINAGTATKLQTARTIAGVSFDGSANISIPYANLTGLPTLGTLAAKSTVTWTSDISGLPAPIASLGIPSQNGNVKIGTNLYNGSTWYGIEFSDSKVRQFLINDTTGTQRSGVYSLSEGWIWAFAATGALDYGTVPWSKLTSIPSTFTPSAHNQAWSTITGTPTTLAGYGITDAVSSSDSRLTDTRTPTNQSWYVIGDNASCTRSGSGTNSQNTLRKSGFYSYQAWADSPVANTWTHLIHSQYHNDAGSTNSWSFDIAANFGSAASPGSAENYYMRCIANGVTTGWRKLWHDGNFTPGNYLPLAGGTMSGNLLGSTSYNIGASGNWWGNGYFDNLYAQNNLVWHAGNFNPATKSDTSHGHTLASIVGTTLFDVKSYLGNTANDWVWFGYNGIHTSSNRYAGFMASKNGDVIASARYNFSGYLNAENSSNITENVAAWNIDRFHVYKNLTVAGNLTVTGQINGTYQSDFAWGSVINDNTNMNTPEAGGTGRSSIGTWTTGTNSPFGNYWYNVINVRHRNGNGDGAGGWGGQLVWGMTGAQNRLAFRSRNSDNTWQSWNEVWTNSNLNQNCSTTASPTFAGLTVNSNLILGSYGQIQCGTGYILTKTAASNYYETVQDTCYAVGSTNGYKLRIDDTGYFLGNSGGALWFNDAGVRYKFYQVTGNGSPSSAPVLYYGVNQIIGLSGSYTVYAKLPAVSPGVICIVIGSPSGAPVSSPNVVPQSGYIYTRAGISSSSLSIVGQRQFFSDGTNWYES